VSKTYQCDLFQVVLVLPLSAAANWVKVSQNSGETGAASVFRLGLAPNSFHEEETAEAFDDAGVEWCKNLENGGYSIPLLDKGDTCKLFPDCLAWEDCIVFAIDPEGGYLLAKNAWRKLHGHPQ